MIGWHISLRRQEDGGQVPAQWDSVLGSKIAEWQGIGGALQWIDDLVDRGLAVALGGNGYPYCYTAQAAHLAGPVLKGPPSANKTWISGPTDIIGAGWAGRTSLDTETLSSCPASEWLAVEAWEESWPKGPLHQSDIRSPLRSLLGE